MSSEEIGILSFRRKNAVHKENKLGINYLCISSLTIMIRKSIVNWDLEALAMVASVHVPHASPPEIGGFLRIGHTGHRKLEALLAANRLYFRRFVFDAAHIAEQIELVKSLRVGGCEIVLDPNSAEMAALGRFNSSVSKLPWGNLRDTLGDLHAADGSVTRSSAPMFRGNFNNLSSAAGGQRR
jgi:hypothetical protein